MVLGGDAPEVLEAAQHTLDEVATLVRLGVVFMRIVCGLDWVGITPLHRAPPTNPVARSAAIFPFARDGRLPAIAAKASALPHPYITTVGTGIIVMISRAFCRSVWSENWHLNPVCVHGRVLRRARIAHQGA